ncbi:hypothetical protein AMAG_02718 [Allomyces macrogynus ATCC 38327]|uniref:Eukaryotic translation initiation factor 2A n=1 Tax=Allomyces macrogynus (strain ATCC 38327) TaxID=578462 RepID=A0A0L0S3G4_ALLM3|nr:hypothetical protein AMAG_02718 [Allomyces macrogynus ATCC 38327]|eukprot:KNE56951.1 hypothetical protein AMAG_02718 [Allomyces macrogynus ATCC 38327]
MQKSQQIVAYRSGADIAACDPFNPEAALATPFARTGAFRHFEYSRDGSSLAYVGPEGLTVVNVATGEDVYTFARKGIIEVSVSPNGSFVCTWERQARPDPETKKPHLNLLIHCLTTKTVIAEHAHKAQASWAPQWTDDETMYARLTSNAEVTIYSTAQRGSTFKLRATNIAAYSLSPGRNPHIAIFIPEAKNGNPAIVKMFSLGNFNVPISNKTFFKADKIKFIWNKIGTGVLLLTSTEVDATGQSYYGENNLYYMSTAGNWDCRVTLDKEGPIHDVAWAPNSKEFAVTYGFIPSKTALFSYRADPIFEFGTGPRNTVSFSPNGRILCIGGFGNLPGQLDFWDMTKRAKIASVSCPNSTQLSWSPDGRYLLTSTLSPRLRVDNGWKLWHYRGVCVASHAAKELFQVMWRPCTQLAPNPESWAKRELSPAPAGLVEAVKPKPAGAYRPPSARLGPRAVPGASFTQPPPQKRTVPGAPQTGGLVPRNGSPQQQQSRGNSASPAGAQQQQNGNRGRTQGGKPASPAPAPAADAAPAPGTDPASIEKRSQYLIKKLKQIMGLKQKMANGETLDPAQVRKLESEGEVRMQLAEMGVTPPL